MSSTFPELRDPEINKNKNNHINWGEGRICDERLEKYAKYPVLTYTLESKYVLFAENKTQRTLKYWGLLC